MRCFCILCVCVHKSFHSSIGKLREHTNTKYKYTRNVAHIFISNIATLPTTVNALHRHKKQNKTKQTYKNTPPRLMVNVGTV